MKDQKQSEEWLQLRKSVEMEHIKFCVHMLLFGLGAVCLVLLIACFATGEQILLGIGFAVLVFLPVFLWEGYRVWRIFRHWQDYTFSEVTLSSVHGGYGKRRTMYFTVLAKDQNGEQVVVNTHRIFFSHGLGVPTVEEYVGTKVVVGYNNTTGNVVVIG